MFLASEAGGRPGVGSDRGLTNGSIVGFAFVSIYVLSAFFPPATPSLSVPTAQTDFVGRLFPGVPAWWLIGRLMSLLIGCWLVVRGCHFDFLTEPSDGDEPASPVRGGFLWAGLVVALLHGASGLFAPALGRSVQLLYVGLFILPTALLWWGSATNSAGWVRRTRWSALLPFAVLILGWLALRVPVVIGSPRSANPVDTWFGWKFLEAADASDFNLLVDHYIVGAGALHLVFQGAGFRDLCGIPLSWHGVQALHFSWLAVTGAFVGTITAWILGRSAAVVATAAFLFSPLVLMIPYQPAILFISLLCTSGLLLLLFAIHFRGSVAALAAFGALSGIACTQPAMIPATGALGGFAVLSVYRRKDFPRIGLLIAACSFAAAVVPALPTAEMFQRMGDHYVGRNGTWPGLEQMVMGQRSPRAVNAFWFAGANDDPALLLLGSFLAPFVIPRTPLRLWGDSLFDPLAAALAAIGLCLCARAARRDWTARVLLCLFVAAILSGVVSSYDRPSLTRLFPMAIPVAVFVAFGFEASRRLLVPDVSVRKTAAAAAAGMALGGIVLFDVINPRILYESWLGITARALNEERHATGEVVVLEPYSLVGRQRTVDWLQTHRVISHVAPVPVRVVPYRDSSSLEPPTRGQSGALYFWSPGHEAVARVSEAICERWPEAAIYTIFDPSGLSRVFAARPVGDDWRPALKKDQWAMTDCAERFEWLRDHRSLFEDPLHDLARQRETLIPW